MFYYIIQNKKKTLYLSIPLTFIEMIVSIIRLKKQQTFKWVRTHFVDLHNYILIRDCNVILKYRFHKSPNKILLKMNEIKNN